MIGRVLLFVLRNLILFRKKDFISRSLVSVFGSELVDTFHKSFNVATGDNDGFGNRVFRCTLKPSVMIMPSLYLRDDLGFTFSHVDLYGETELELVDRINSQCVRDHPE